MKKFIYWYKYDVKVEGYAELKDDEISLHNTHGKDFAYTKSSDINSDLNKTIQDIFNEIPEDITNYSLREATLPLYTLDTIIESKKDNVKDISIRECSVIYGTVIYKDDSYILTSKFSKSIDNDEIYAAAAIKLGTNVSKHYRAEITVTDHSITEPKVSDWISTIYVYELYLNRCFRFRNINEKAAEDKAHRYTVSFFG